MHRGERSGRYRYIPILSKPLISTAEQSKLFYNDAQTTKHQQRRRVMSCAFAFGSKPQVEISRVCLLS